MKKSKPILIFLLIAVLLAGNFYFLLKSNQPDYLIQIGKPMVDENNWITAVDYTDSEPLKRKDDVDMVLFSLLSGKSEKAPAVVEFAPTAVLMIRNAGEYKVLYHVTLWVDGDTVVFAMGNNDWEHFKRIEYADSLIELLEKHL